jgi:hypothetical protein
MEGVNLTNIYCKHFYKYHNVPPVQQYDKKNEIKLKKKKEHQLGDLRSHPRPIKPESAV